jgi:TonB family protein
MFPGGTEAMNEYLVNSMDKAPKNQSGKVKVDFVIDKAGKPIDVKIHDSENPALDAFCLRMISEMPVWQPGYQGGSLVSVPLSIPLKFK